MSKPAGRDTAKQFEALEREIDAMFRAASRRSAEYAAAAARDLHLDHLAERFQAEAESHQHDEKEGKG
jgi:hypothetical protein